MDERTRVLEVLYCGAGPRLLRYLQRHATDAGVAEELLQDTFVAAAKDFDGLQAAINQEAWLFGIAKNLLRNRARRARLLGRATLNMELTAPQTVMDPRIDAMREEIQKLPEAQREAITMRLVDELSYEQIAEATGVPTGTVRSRIHHAVQRLRRWAAARSDGTGRPRNVGAAHAREKGE